MTPFFLTFLLAALPGIFWDQGSEIADLLKKSGIDQVYVPPDRVEAWKGTGVVPLPLSRPQLEARTRLVTPGVAADTQFASATQSPWVNANGARFLRASQGKFFYDLPKGKGDLAAAEAFAYGADAILKIVPDDLVETSRMLGFLRQLPADNSPQRAEMLLVEDGSELMGEIMNLLVRRNLLFKVASAPDPQFKINVQLGTTDYPEEMANDPNGFALEMRRRITDAKRLVRIYGSETVICRLTGTESHLRLHLLNYGRQKLQGIRVRLRGSYSKTDARVFPEGLIRLEDQLVASGATEFSVPQMAAYAVVDLESQK